MLRVIDGKGPATVHHSKHLLSDIISVGSADAVDQICSYRSPETPEAFTESFLLFPPNCHRVGGYMTPQLWKTELTRLFHPDVIVDD